MEVTEEQRKRAEANRLAALEKRKRAAETAVAGRQDPWRLFKCRKIPSPVLQEENKPQSQPQPPPARFRVVLEICSPDEFSIIPEPVPDSPFPGEAECFWRIEDCLSLVPLRYIESQVGRKTVYKLVDYELVSNYLKKIHGLQLQEIPYKTRRVVENFSASIGDRWIPCMPHHLPDNEVDQLVGGLPKLLRDGLLPFQFEGVRFGLRRGGRCLIADEMGLGKTLQAITIASCFMNEGPILIVCPAILRYSWAEELERWLPFCLPTDIHLVFGHQNCLDYIEGSPKVVVISYTMLRRLRRSMLEHHWAVMIVDESHNIRCTKKKSESGETEAVLDMAAKINRILLLSGTPSLSRPFDIFHQINILWPRLLGNDKYEFASNYCSTQLVRSSQGKIYKDFSKGIHLEELNVLLSQTLMIRRLKENVLLQLPPKRRQIIRVKLKGHDISLATSAFGRDIVCIDSACSKKSLNQCSAQKDDNGKEKENSARETCDKNGSIRTSKDLSYQELGIAKISAFSEWFSNHNITTDLEGESSIDMKLPSQKMIIFAHHLKVLDGIQEAVCEKGIQFVCIDGSTSARDRKEAVDAFRSSSEVKIAIIGITAGGVGLDFSSAQNVVFVELPKSASEMLQAEDRAHRRGQTNAVNIYIFCAKDTLDESHWLHLNKSLYRVSLMMNGKVNAIKEIEVDRICHLGSVGDFLHCANLEENAAVRQQVEVNNKNGDYEFKDGDNGSEANEICLLQTNPFQFETNKVSISDVGDHSAAFGNSECNNSDDLQNGNTDAMSLTKISVTQSDQFGKNCFAIPENVQNDTPVLVDGNIPVEPDSLRLEVSQYTGRMHLYVCSCSTDSRPRPLFENFRPEDLESMAFSATNIKKKASPQAVKENPAYWDVFKRFVKEWNDLRPVERNKLLGKPLQLPLNLELCYLKETNNHGREGLLKGGSKRRVTPLSDINSSLPPDAVWKKITLHKGSAKEKDYFQAWTIADVPLCKFCQKPCIHNLVKKPEYFEDLFCNLTCFEEYRIRTSQRSLREALFQIEHGVCTQCHLDCHKLVKSVRPLSIERRREYIKRVAPRLAEKENMLEKLVSEPTEGNGWHADHIVPVYKGGGECRLENMRTLCVTCHSEVTAAQRTDRRFTKIRAKEQLKIAMKEIKDDISIKFSGSSADGNVQLPPERNTDEDGLIIQVPGSAYSKDNG